jgi:hypothetical protein
MHSARMKNYIKMKMMFSRQGNRGIAENGWQKKRTSHVKNQSTMAELIGHFHLQHGTGLQQVCS